jgi:hypothetical protein
MSISSATRQLPKFLPQFNSHPVLHFPQTYTSRCLYSSSSSRPLICRPSSFTINTRSTSRTSIHRRALCTTSPLHARGYARFTPDPERPFDVRKWNAETRIVAVLLIGGLGYYIVQSVLRCPLRFLSGWLADLLMHIQQYLAWKEYLKRAAGASWISAHLPKPLLRSKGTASFSQRTGNESYLPTTYSRSTCVVL